MASLTGSLRDSSTPEEESTGMPVGMTQPMGKLNKLCPRGEAAVVKRNLSEVGKPLPFAFS